MDIVPCVFPYISTIIITIIYFFYNYYYLYNRDYWRFFGAVFLGKITYLLRTYKSTFILGFCYWLDILDYFIIKRVYIGFFKGFLGCFVGCFYSYRYGHKNRGVFAPLKIQFFTWI